MTDLSAASPAAVVELALRLRDEWHYDEVAALCDPVSTDAFFQRWCETRRPTAEEVLQENPTVGRDQAAAIAARLAELDDDEKRTLAQSLPRVSSFAEVISLGPQTFLSRWLECVDPRYGLVTRVRAAGRPVPEMLLHAAPGTTYEVTRQEWIDESMVRVWYREIVDAGNRTAYAAESFQETRRLPNGDWRLVVSASMLKPLGGSAQIVPPELSDLFGDDLK